MEADEAKKHLRILMLSWEYPPRIVGGISRVVEGLSRSLTEQGHEVHVITNEMPGSLLEESDRGVFVHRVRIETPTPTFHTWVMMMNHYFSKRAGRLAKETGKFDIVHVHDWLVLPSGAEFKTFLGTSLVSTLHSLEFRRSSGISTPESKMVDSLEWWITYESAIVIVCSTSMKYDSRKQFQLPEDKIRVIPIGIDSNKFEGLQPNRHLVRERHGVNPGEKVILFVGRLTEQKGCEFLIRAIPFVARFSEVRLLIVGDGYLRGELELIAAKSGAAGKITFVGYLNDHDLSELLLSSDVMVIPSIYEPFGVVALEAMAANLPIVASNIDGLAEIIRHEENGILVFPKDSSSIAWGISRILSDPKNTQRLIDNARKDVEVRFSWDSVSKQTVQAYRDALKSVIF
ncbi:MAG: glycosyltransferase family 4 protein [Thaumarchaeota archaeon]|nr:glycosyltransferase family 4 protein [Nitrososphaerota archaeon]